MANWQQSRPRNLYVGLGLLLVGACGAHLYAQFPGAEHFFAIAILDHVFDLALVVALAAIIAGVGNDVLTRCRYGFEQPLDQLLFSFAIGGGILATIILACGLGPGLRLNVLVGVVLVTAVLSRRGVQEVPLLVRNSVGHVREHAHPLAIAVFLLIVVLLFLQALLPVTDWDSLMYHVRVPAQFLRAGVIHVPEDNIHSSLVQLVHMLYLLPLALKSAAGPALLSVVYTVGIGLTTFVCALRLFNRSVASGCLVTLWGNTAMLLVAVMPRVDAAAAFCGFLAHYALLDMVVSGTPRNFVLAAVLLGIAAGIKLNALAYAFALLPLIGWTAWMREKKAMPTLRGVVIFGVVVLAAASPWLLKSWWIWGSPFYPFFTLNHVEPWLSALFSGPIPTIEANQMLRQVVEQLRAPFSLSSLFWTQSSSLMEWGGPYHLTPLFGFLPLWIIFRGHKLVVWLIVPTVAYTVIVLAKAPSPSARFLLPAVPALTIAATYFAYSLCVRLFARWRFGMAYAVVAGLALLPAALPLTKWVTNLDMPRYLGGAESSDAYLDARLHGGITPRVSRELPRGSRVLMLFEARGYYFDVPALEDPHLMNWWLLLKTDSPLHCLKSAGITHVLVNTAALDMYQRHGINPDVLQTDALLSFAFRCLKPIRQESEFILFEVRD